DDEAALGRADAEPDRHLRQAGQVPVPLHRDGSRRGRHEGHADGHLGARLLLRQFSGRPASRRAVVVLAAVLLLAAAPAGRAAGGTSVLAALPSVSPPPAPQLPMRWSRSPTPASASSFAAGRAVVGLRAGVDPRRFGPR